MNDQLNHILVVGGSGMLAGLSIRLANEGNCVSVVGRTQSKIVRLASQIKDSGGVINPLAVDYSGTDELQSALRNSLVTRGAISTAICWVHSHSPKALTTIADEIGDQSKPVPYFHIVGSAMKNPSSADQQIANELRNRSDIKYHRIILGHQLVGSIKRWLTHEEICSGVYEAIKSPKPEMIIGLM